MTNGTTTWSFTYDANGMRKSRSDGTNTYTYLYNGSQLVQMTKGTDVLYFDHATNTVTWNGTTYYYVHNLQGDVVAILNSGGTAVVTYSYDAWGNLLATTGSMASTLGTLNPLTYRGYVYDFETQLYYLQSRYYDPEVGRFLNADAYASTGQGLLGNNMFAYCGNNPVNYIDPTGLLAYPGEIHNEVVRRISQKYGYHREQRILYPVGWGRADLISPSGEVWEVKRDRSWHIKAGKKQVQKYVSNTWKNEEDVTLSIGGYIEGGSFPYKSGLTTYRVTYRYAGDGVIAYDYFIEDYDWQTIANTGMVAGAAMVAGLISGMLGSPTTKEFNFMR